MTYRRIKRSPPPPSPPPPTPEQLDADVADAIAALADASSAASLLRVQIDKVVRQQLQVEQMAKEIARFHREREDLERRLRGVLANMPSRDVLRVHAHAERMRRAAVFWEAEAKKLGHAGAHSLKFSWERIRAAAHHTNGGT